MEWSKEDKKKCFLALKKKGLFSKFKTFKEWQKWNEERRGFKLASTK